MTTDKLLFSDIQKAAAIELRLQAMNKAIDDVSSDKFDIVQFDDEKSAYAWETYPVQQSDCKRIAKNAIIELIKAQIKECENTLIEMGCVPNKQKLLEGPVAVEPA